MQTIALAMGRAPSPPGEQRGAALLVFMLLLSMSVAAFLLSGMSQFSRQLASPFHNSAVLAQAKTALIAYARLSDPDLSSQTGLNYRYLPCPDQDGDGLAESPCGASSVEGWLPWMSLGLPPLRDASGSCLRYAVSAAYKPGAGAPPLITALPDGDFSLNRPDGLISEGVVAVLFAPGENVGGQSRGLAVGTATECGSSVILSNSNLSANYLDTFAGINNAVLPGFITAPAELDATTSFNDNLTTILSSEL
jgi:hypothetical protein